MSNIEVFDKKIDDIKLSLEELKKETSVEQKTEKVKSAKEKIDQTKSEINKKLDELKKLGDATSLEEAKKLEEKLVVLENISGEISSLENDVKNNNKPENEEKGRFKRQREGVTSKEEWKENTWTNVGRVAMGVGAVSVAWRGIKKLFGIGKNKEKKEGDGDKKEKKSRWKKALLRGAGIGGGILLWKNRGSIKDRFGKLFGKEKNKLSFEESIPLVESDLGNISEWDINAQRGLIKFDETSSEIRSYGKTPDGKDIGTKINKKDMEIEGLKTKFSDYKELIFTANFINYLKFHYVGKGDDDAPFFQGNNTGDIYMRTNTTGKMEEKEVISGGMWSTLRKYAPSLDPSLLSRTTNVFGTTDTKGKERLCSYLNTLPGWKHGDAGNNYNEEHKDDEKNRIAMDLQEEIKNTASDQEFGGTRGEIRAVKINDFEYDIESWSYKSKIKFSPEIKIDGMNISFPTVKEAIRTANFFNRMKKDYGGKCDKNKPFTIEYEYTDFALWISSKDRKWGKLKVLEDDTLNEKYPTVYDKKNRDTFLKFLNNLPPEPAEDPTFKGWM